MTPKVDYNFKPAIMIICPQNNGIISFWIINKR